jgi:hypothetical protein
VADEYTRNYQSRQESRDGHVVKGVYNVLEDDGHMRTVEYGDNGDGFWANVSRAPSSVYGGAGSSTAAAGRYVSAGVGRRGESSERY